MVSFADAVKLGFQRYFDFAGRSARAEYWWWLLFIAIVGSVANIVDLAVGTGFIVGMIWWLVTIIPNIAIGVRRLHDIGRSGWWLLLHLVPLIGTIVLIVWAVQRGDEGDNSHGQDPLAATA